MKSFLNKHKGIAMLCVAMIVGITNYMVYPWYIKRDMQLVEVPIANQIITQGTIINEDMLDMILVNPTMLPQGVRFGDGKPVVGYYVKEGYTICKNGFIYSDSLSTKQTSMGTTYASLGENEVAFTIQVDNQYNQKDTIRTGQKNDIYYFTNYIGTDGVKKYLIGKMKENARVLDVSVKEHDSYVTFAISEEEVGLFLIAQASGDLIPLVSSVSSSFIQDVEYYDIFRTHAWLKQRNQILSFSVDSME